jgi:hypothetical protein
MGNKPEPALYMAIELCSGKALPYVYAIFPNAISNIAPIALLSSCSLWAHTIPTEEKKYQILRHSPLAME